MAAKPTTTGRRLRTAVVSTLAVLAACGHGEPPPLAVDLAFIDPPAEAVLRTGRFYTGRDVSAWDLSDPAEAAAWQVERADLQVRSSGGGLLIQSSRANPVLTRGVELDASEVTALEVTLGWVKGVGFTLLWAPPGERFSAERRVQVPADRVPTRVEASVRVPLAGHPGWRGRVGRLRLSFAVPPRQELLVRRLRARSETVDAAALTAALGRSWIVDLGGEARAALLAPPGLPVERQLTVPAAALLRFAYATPGGYGPIGFRVAFAPHDGAAEHELFATEVPAAAAGAWHEAEVDLAGLAGTAGTLRLATTGDAPADPAAGFPAWGHPEVLSPAALGPPLNLVLISVDTLRADRLSLYGYDRPTSPRLDTWAAERATVFDTAIAAAPWTLPSHVSMLTGVDAHRHGVNFDSPAPPRSTLLAERLRAAGWRTLAVTGGGFVQPRYGFAQGFDRFVYASDRRGAHDERELATGIEEALRLLARAAEDRRPFFLFLHTYEVHQPFRARQPWFRELAGYDPPWGAGSGPDRSSPDNGFLGRRDLVPQPLPGAVEAGELAADAPPPESAPIGGPELADLAGDLYDSGVAYTDHQLGRLLDRLRELGFDRRTVVALTSDHGEALGEDAGAAGHSYLTDETLLVPLVVAVPDGRGAGRRVTRQVRSVDLVPTLLELAGLPADGGLDGRSLLPLIDGATAGEIPAEAWSYAPKTNHGAALRLAGRLGFVLRHSVWPPIAGDGRLTALGRRERPPAVAGAAESDDEAEEMRRRLVAELATSYEGLLLRLANGGDRPLTGSLRGPMVSGFGVKSLDLDCACVSWADEDIARIELPPGSSFTLRFEDPVGRELAVELAVAGGGAAGRAVATFEPAALDGAEALSWDGRAWSRSSAAVPADAAPPAPVTGALLWWRGAPVRAEALAGEDAELEEQLRALGYIN